MPECFNFREQVKSGMIFVKNHTLKSKEIIQNSLHQIIY